MQTRHGRTPSSNMDLLMELDPGPFVTSSPGWNTGEDTTSDARHVNSSMSLLEKKTPILKRDEDEAWFEAQSNGNAPLRRLNTSPMAAMEVLAAAAVLVAVAVRMAATVAKLFGLMVTVLILLAFLKVPSLNALMYTALKALVATST
ncbi:dna polymerase v family and armadillo-type fold domain-containing protein [Neofusicoccum parvum]|uniref:Dna polymerase v family and armadillo-type fold domain-containing protein n=1 Tax=Neofusicoccum parvum TaxID=310453 RepID=A0ACB5RWI9_9PEZI|nr:dna polymerase v family and armadillo-type fold domain-containing protein [Neofusicoccum parvum]